MSVRAARGTTCLLDGWATLGAGNRARFPGPDDGLPPVPLPTVPLPEDGLGPPVPGNTPTDPGAGEDEAEPRVDTSLSYCGLQERIAAVAPRRSGGHGAAHRRRRGHGPLRRRARRARRRLSAAPGCRAGRPRWRWPPRTCAWTAGVSMPGEPADLTAFLEGCPLSLVTLDQLTDCRRPGRGPDRRRHRSAAPGERAWPRIDEEVGRLRAAVGAAARGDPAAAGRDLRGQRRPAAAARRHRVRARVRHRRLADLGQHRPGALRAAHRPGPHRAATRWTWTCRRR